MTLFEVRRFHPRAARSMVIAALLVFAGGSPDVIAQPRTASDFNPPSNIALTPALLETVHDMLVRSATFRAQCQTLAAAPHLHVALRVEPKSGPYRARSVIRRYRAGVIIAVVDIPVLGNRIERIAHEFEHIVEQLEGIDLPRLAAIRSPGVYDLSDGYETDRACLAGQQVARECLRDAQHSEPACGNPRCRAAEHSPLASVPDRE